MPELPKIVPMVSYEDAGAAADWLISAFGFEETDRVTDDGTVTHVTLRMGEAAVFVGKPGDTYVSPVRLRRECAAAARMYEAPWVVDGVWVQVAGDVAAHRERAREAGARLLSEIEEPPIGFRLYRVEDPEGHRWMFAEPTSS
jgi:uncharacterized glyoxalase superfamily protein PhnB